MSGVQFGKQIDTTSFANGKPTATERSVEESIAVDGIVGALSVIGEALREIGDTYDKKITFVVSADHVTMQPDRIRKLHKVERKIT